MTAVSIAIKRLDTSDKPTKRKEDHNEEQNPDPIPGTERGL